LAAIDLPESCQLNPKFDLYAEQESNKREEYRGDWKCVFCRKHFKSEFYLDRHMHNMHQDKLAANATSTTCLADLCPVFGCEPQSKSYQAQVAASRALSRGGGKSRNSGSGSSSNNNNKNKDFFVDTCTEAEVERHKYVCQVMTRRCFSGVNSALQSALYDDICGKLHCERGILRGSISLEKEEDETLRKGPWIIWLLKIMLISVILIFVVAYAVLVGLPWRNRHSTTAASQMQANTRANVHTSTRRGGSSFSSFASSVFKSIMGVFGGGGARVKGKKKH